jgi:hypothetical protein
MTASAKSLKVMAALQIDFVPEAFRNSSPLTLDVVVLDLKVELVCRHASCPAGTLAPARWSDGEAREARAVARDQRAHSSLMFGALMSGYHRGSSRHADPLTHP